MGKLFNPSKKSFSGPWALDNNALEELHEIVEFANSELEKTYNEKLESQAEKEFADKLHSSIEEAKAYQKKYSYDTIRKDIILISKDESKLKDSSIKELLFDSKIKNFKPKEFSIDLEYGKQNKFSFDLKQRFEGELEYEIISSKSEIEDKINYQLENWLDKYKPFYIQTLWLKTADLITLLSFIVCLISALNISTTYKPNSIQYYQNRIEKIIKSGVNNENQYEALDLLLKISTDYTPPDLKVENRIDETSKSIAIVSFVFLIIGIIKPKTIIGLGKHKKLFNFYKQYMRIVLVIIPSAIIYPYIIDIIKNLLNN